MYAVVGKILSVLEDLDRYVFDKMDPNTNCLDVLAAKIWGPCQPGQGVSSQVKKNYKKCNYDLCYNFGPVNYTTSRFFYVVSCLFLVKSGLVKAKKCSEWLEPSEGDKNRRKHI